MREGVETEGTKGQRFKESKKQNLRGRGYQVGNRRETRGWAIKAMFEAKPVELCENPPTNKLGAQIHSPRE